MIVLSSYSMSWSQSNVDDSTNVYLPSTGVLEYTYCDSVLIPIETLKLANAKMVELKYDKEIIFHLREEVYNDSIVISTLKEDLAKSNKKSKRYKNQRNILAGSSLSLLTILIIILL